MGYLYLIGGGLVALGLSIIVVGMKRSDIFQIAGGWVIMIAGALIMMY